MACAWQGMEQSAAKVRPCAMQGTDQDTAGWALCTAGHGAGHGPGCSLCMAWAQPGAQQGTNGCTVGHSQDTARCPAQHGAAYCPGHSLCTAQRPAGHGARHYPGHGLCMARAQPSARHGMARHGAEPCPGHGLRRAQHTGGHGAGYSPVRWRARLGTRLGTACAGPGRAGGCWLRRRHCPGRAVGRAASWSCPACTASALLPCLAAGQPGEPAPCDSSFAATAGDKPGPLLFRLGIGGNAQPSAGWEI